MPEKASMNKNNFDSVFSTGLISSRGVLLLLLCNIRIFSGRSKASQNGGICECGHSGVLIRPVDRFLLLPGTEPATPSRTSLH